MKSEDNQREQLLRDIKHLQREIAILSATLAFKKLESNHPALERLASEVDRMGALVHNNARRFADYGRRHLDSLDSGKIAKTTGRIFLIGIIGYAIFQMFGWLEEERERR